MKFIYLAICLTFSFALTAQAKDPSEPPFADTDTISIEFPDENRSAILQNVGELYGIEVFFPSDYKDTKTALKIRDVTWRQIFRYALKDSEYSFNYRDSKAFVFKLGSKGLDFDKFLIGDWKFGTDYILSLEGTRSYSESGEYRENVRVLGTTPERSVLQQVEIEGSWSIVGRYIEIEVNKTSDPASIPVGKTLRQRVLNVWERELVFYDDEKQLAIRATKVQPDE